jgi:SulP family sulfate permease
VLLWLGPLARLVPLAGLSAILFVVAWHMGEWREIPDMLRLTRTEVTVWLVTFGLTVFADLTIAVEAGMMLAALLFIRKVATTTTVSRITPEEIERGRSHVLQGKTIPDGVAIFRIHGPFLFGATTRLEEATRGVEDLPQVVILRLRNMTAIDSTGLQAIEDLADRLHASGRVLILCGARAQPARYMKRLDFERHLGADNVCEHVQGALDRARDVLAVASRN